MLSPRNPLMFSMLERSAAVSTTIPILNNLFLADNDILCFQWIERLAALTGSTKWDGVAVCVKNGRIVPVLVEFSGGIKANSTESKENGDELKMLESMTKMLDYSEQVSNRDHPIPQFYVRSFDNRLFFEALYKLQDGSLCKRCYVNMPFPTNANELKEYVDCVEDMFAWKQAVVKYAQDSLKSNQ